ncbi:tRNA preQ1(34) S-adenosylmethionine ribosyltransferase-isomerase QueA [Alienimonas californiensis]|uniref:S-adenosylmethionine:tRNA ribosyltransferase-isomerase n=1 Tax=Alienimonas californiensis TaxID=2527989 RepID=A0A517PCQ7_9PLAN|nr:tRNA preQ1(34) S-adenosylmethionine ribosyltransferase-isomerase QueA [Alienimonas californiensis]QDT17150.1 S-adenosylmethionine:tRNA ribosyltransferase-isomerase [Alienimonas californiensis]
MPTPPPDSSPEDPADLSVAAYDYHLPPEQIAARPAPRGTARLLTLDRETGAVGHRSIADLPSLLAPGDRLVLNDSRVVPARLRGVREATGGKWEGLFLSVEADGGGAWRVMSKTRGTLTPGETVRAEGADGATLRLRMERREPGGVWTALPLDDAAAASPFAALEAVGSIPLPPYIGRDDPDEQDRTDYQTVFADRPGSVAAPTAGLHFTPELIAACESTGVNVSRVTLHVGVGTFRPMSGDSLVEHRMHAEFCELSPATAAEVRATREAGGRVVAVGTTACRTLEAAAQANGGAVGPFCGQTEIFIHPPYRFAGIDGLLTNFHLPKSTLLVLVSALAGRERVLAAYREAVTEGYRFFSYGDAMLIL